MLRKTLKDLSTHSFIYSFSWFASSAAGILLLPVYTRYLSKADYGILELLEYTNAILRLIMIAGFHTALARFFNNEDDLERKKIVASTCTLFILITGALGSLTCLFFNDSLSFLILGSREYKTFININIAVLYADLVILISSTCFIVSKRSKLFLTYSLSRLIAAIIANLYFIVILRLGAIGMLYGHLLSMGVLAVIITFHNFYDNGIRMDTVILTKIIKFGIPLVPAMLCATIMHNADRFLIRYYCSLEAVGLYALGYKLPFMLNALILQSFNYIWTGATMYEIQKLPDSAYQYRKITTYFITLFVFTQLFLSIFSIAIINILAAPKFFDAHKVIPIVSLGLCFHAFYTFFTVGAFLKSKTWLLNLSYIPAAGINIIGNMIFLPKYGYMVAAWMSMITYFIFAVTAYFSCKNILNVTFEFKRLSILFMVALITYSASSFFTFENLLVEILKGLCLFLIFSAFVVLSGWLTKGEREFLKEKLAVFIVALSKIKK